MHRKIQGAILFAAALFSSLAAASEFHGQVTFGGLPVPGATVTATHGTKKVTTFTDQGGAYSFADLADGAWKIEIEMQCFAPLQGEVTIAAQMPAARWEMKLLPAEQIKAHVQTAKTPVSATTPALHAAKPKNPDADAPEQPKPPEPEDAKQQSADGFLINGSVNNAATSQYELSHAFGNRRPGSKSLYTGGLSAIIENSEFDARPYSLSGQETPKDLYDRITLGLTFGGPIEIPRLLPHGPNFFVAYQWTRNSAAAIESGMVPTVLERTGDLSALRNALGQPTTIYDPATGVPFAGNIVPISKQAQALMQLYPPPNIAAALPYNYQAQVLNGIHQDVLQTRLDKSLGRKEQLYGGFNLQSSRAGNTNFFGFVDSTDTLGIDSNVNWMHRLSSRRYGVLGYKFSRQRTQVAPYFANRANVAGAAGIAGNDQDAAQWGPPALNFSSGIFSLGDDESSFNRNRTDAFSASMQIYHGRHNITAGGDLRKQEYNDLFQQDPRGTFTFTGAATASSAAKNSGSDLADFLLGVPDTSSIAFGNADKYLRQTVYDAYATDDWRILPVLTINAGLRWEYGAPMTELHGRLVNLDLTSNFSAAAPVLGSDPLGAVTGNRYPGSLIRPDRSGVEPRVGISWRPIPASTIVVRAGYGLYHDTSVYLNSTLQLAQQAPLSKSLSVTNSAACPLTLANGFNPCTAATADSLAMDPNFRIGYAQTWQLSVQRDLPAALQLVATYLGVKGTHGVQEFLPNTYPIGAAAPCPGCPSGFVYRTSGGDSTRESGLLQLRRRLRSGFTASLQYTFAKSLDHDAYLGGQGHTSAGASQAGANAAIAQNWLNPRAERAPSNFDQRHLLNLQAQYTSGEGLGGGSLMSGWRGRIMKEWTVITQVSVGTGLPETPVYFATVPGAAFTGTIRPTLTGSSLYNASSGLHLNPAAYSAPLTGQWGTAGRNSITGPGQFSLDSSLSRTFRPSRRLSLDARVDATNLLNHADFTGWNATLDSSQFGLPLAANPMRSLQTTLRLRF